MYFRVNRIPQIVLVGALRRILVQSPIVRLYPLSYTRQYCQFISPVDIDTVDKLKLTFGWTDEESNAIETFVEKRGKECLKSLAYLCSKNVSISTITQNLHLLNISSDRLKADIDRIETAQWRQIEDFIPFLSVPPKIFEIVNFDGLKNLIHELSDKYSLTVSEISRSFARNPDLLLKSPYYFFHKFDIMVEYGFHPRDIIRDPSIFRINELRFNERIAVMKTHNVCRPKPWMIKCENKIFERMIEVREELNELSSDTFQYVAFTLDLHGKRMVSVFKNHQFVNDLDLDTVTRALDILRQIYTNKEIAKNIKLLKLSPALLEERLSLYRELRDDKCPPNKLALVNFDKYLSSIRINSANELNKIIEEKSEIR